MKRTIFTILLTYLVITGTCQTYITKYNPSTENPYGLLNPDAPPHTSDYALLIGQSMCKSISRNSEGNWNKDSTNMIWRFKYIMDGLAIQDEIFSDNAPPTGSIRQYNADSSKWYVTFFNSANVSPNPPVWHGNMESNEIVLYKKQKAPNGTDGFYRITYENVSNEGFDWRMEWLNKEETFTYTVGKTFCVKLE